MSANVTTNAAGFGSKTYDFVIIGAGTAGLALASRYETMF
jgi:cation diffusion facilitator CzcD-associated flavoprotein CzcO